MRLVRHHIPGRVTHLTCGFVICSIALPIRGLAFMYDP